MITWVTTMAERRVRRWTLLRYPDYGRLWLGHGLSLLGGHMSTLALPLLAAALTGSLLLLAAALLVAGPDDTFDVHAVAAVVPPGPLRP